MSEKKFTTLALSKIRARFNTKYEEFIALGLEKVKALELTKMSNTDYQALVKAKRELRYKQMEANTEPNWADVTPLDIKSDVSNTTQEENK